MCVGWLLRDHRGLRGGEVMEQEGYNMDGDSGGMSIVTGHL